jgi:ENTS family enterobactin (siderophore) exporter
MFVVGSIGGVVVVHPLLCGVLQRRYGYLSVWAAFCIGSVAITISQTVGTLGAALVATGAFGTCLSMTGIDRRVLAIPPSVRVRVASATLLTGQLTSMLSFAFYGALYGTFHGTLHGASYGGSNTWRDVGGPYGWYVGLACIAALAAYLAREPWRMLNPNDADDDIETFYMRRYPDLFDESQRVRGHTAV